MNHRLGELYMGIDIGLVSHGHTRSRLFVHKCRGMPHVSIGLTIISWNSLVSLDTSGFSPARLAWCSAKPV